MALLAGLMSHENTDIAIGVVEVLQELTDEDVGAEVDDLEEGADEATASQTRQAMGLLIDDLVSPLADNCECRLVRITNFV